MNSKYKQVKNIWSKKKNWKTFQRIREYISYKSLLEKYPLSEFFWSVFSRIRARKTPNTDTFHTVNPSFSVYIYPTKYLHLSFLVKFRKKNNHQKVFLGKYLNGRNFCGNTVWKVSLFGVILVRIPPHSDWITSNTDTLCAVQYNYKGSENTFHFTSLCLSKTNDKKFYLPFSHITVISLHQ